MPDLIKALSNVEGVNLMLLLSVVGMGVAIIKLWMQSNKERALDREDRAKANEQHAQALERLGNIVNKMAEIVSDLRVTIASCSIRRDR